MRRLLVIICAVVLSAPVFGQKMEQTDPGLKDVMMLLKGAGYGLFSFAPQGVEILSFEVKEYAGGKEVVGGGHIGGSSSSEPCERVNIGFRKGSRDSLAVAHMSIPGVVLLERNLVMKPLVDQNGRLWYNYDTRPFKVSAVKDGFVPLVLYGSFWIDSFIDGYPMMRFCGESEIEPDMSSKILKKVPHYYVIGVNIKNRK